MHSGISTGAPCPPPVMRQIKDLMHMPDLRIGYGTTELSPLVTLGLQTDDLEKRLNTIGVVTDHEEVRLVNSNNQVVPIGEPGNYLPVSFSPENSQHYSNRVKTSLRTRIICTPSFARLISNFAPHYPCILAELAIYLNSPEFCSLLFLIR